MNIHEAIVIGSGPSGIIGAQKLIENNINTLLIDAVLDKKEHTVLKLNEENKDNSYLWINRGYSYQYKMGQERQVIKDCLENSDKPLAPKEIAEVIGKKTNAVNVLLRKMLASSEVIQPEVGKYTVMNEKDIPF